MTSRLVLLLFVFVLSTGWTIRDLGTLPGCTGSFAAGLNDSGVIVGAATGCGGAQKAVVFEPGPVTPIPVGSAFPGSVANDVNESGFIVGQAEGRAFTYPLGGAVTVFGAGTGMYAVDDAMNAAGFRFVTADIQAADVWVGGVTPYYLGHLGSGASSTARDIENVPVVVGWSEHDQARRGLNHAFLWEDGTMSDLGTLGGSFSGADAVAVSKWPDPSYATMFIAGSAQVPGGDHHAFLWTAGVMSDLGTLPGHDYSRALGVNRSGIAVGISRSPAFEQRAVMWESGTIIDLNTLVDPKEGWILNSAFAINEAGQIVGSGIHFGELRAFVMTP